MTKATKAPAIVRVPSKETFAAALNHVIRVVSGPIEAFEKAKCDFVARFEKDPVDALTWRGESMMQQQHSSVIALRIQHALNSAAEASGFNLMGLIERYHAGEAPAATTKPFTEGAVEELETLAAGIVKAMETFKGYLLSEVLCKAKSTSRSTSAISNLADQAALSALAEAVDSCMGASPSYVAHIFERVYIAR